MPTEADTCRTYVLPSLYAAGWADEQMTFKDGMDTSAQALPKVRAGQFIYSRLFGGAYGVVDPALEGYGGSNGYPVLEIDPDLATPGSLEAYFSQRSLWPKLAGGTKGPGARRQRIQPDQMLSHELMPPLHPQQRMVTPSRVVGSASAQTTTRGEHFDALPAPILAQACAWAL